MASCQQLITENLRQPGTQYLKDTYASWPVQSGANLKVIQDLLGHESIQTTLIYAHLSPDSRIAAVNLLDDKDF